MRTLTLRRFLIALPLLVAGPALGAEPSPEHGFDGNWDSTFGPMRLAVDGTAVTGTYVMGGVPCSISGHQEGATLVFEYREPDVSGEGRFELARDGRAFSGKWRPRGEISWAPWAGTRPQDRAPEGFEGIWDSDFGRLRMIADGDTMRGIYSFSEGSLEGTLDGRALHFKYRDSAKGEGEFTLAADARSFTGRWRMDGTTDWKPWAGTRVTPVPGRRWLVVIERRWESSLADREYSYGEMLRTFFTPSPQVQVRQRSFTDRKSLEKWLREATLLAEPTVVYISSHGDKNGITADDGSVGADALAQALKAGGNVSLIHFGACDVMGGSIPRQLQKRLAPAVRVPISGFAQSVDWSASAITDFLYLDLILSRGQDPAAAAAELRRMMPLAAKHSGAAGYDGVSFRFRPADASQ